MGAATRAATPRGLDRERWPAAEQARRRGRHTSAITTDDQHERRRPGSQRLPNVLGRADASSAAEERPSKGLPSPPTDDDDEAR